MPVEEVLDTFSDDRQAQPIRVDQGGTPADFSLRAVTWSMKPLSSVSSSMGRIREAVQCEIGHILHPDEVAADKVLALFGRAAARDLVDVIALWRTQPPTPMTPYLGGH